MADFSHCIRLKPEDYSGYYNRAVTYYSLGDLQNALADFSKTIEFNSRYPASYYGRCNVYSRLGHLDEAIADFNKAQELERDHSIDPGDQDGYYHAGLAYQRQGDSETALKYLNAALRLCQQHQVTLMVRVIEAAIQSIEP